MSSAGKWVLGLLLLVVGAVAVARAFSNDTNSRAQQKDVTLPAAANAADSKSKTATPIVSADVDCKKPCISTGEIDQEAITTAKLASGSVTLSKLAFEVPNLSELQAEIDARKAAEANAKQAVADANAAANAANSQLAAASQKTAADITAAAKTGIDTEAAARAAGDQSVTDAFKAADAGLQTSLNQEIVDRKKDIDTANVALTKEIADRASADAGLRSDLLSTDPSKTPTVRVNNNEIVTGAVTGGVNVSGKATGSILERTIVGANLQTETVTDQELAAGSVGTSEIQDESILSEDIKNGEVKTSDIGTGEVKTANLADASNTATPTGVTNAKIENNAVTSDKILNGEVTSADIADGTIVGGAGGDIAADTITAGELGAESVGSSELADNAVDTAAIQTGAVTLAKLGADSVDSSKIVDGSVTGTDVGSKTITGANIADFTIEGGADNGVGAVVNQIKDGSITSDDLAADAVSKKLQPNSVTSEIIKNGEVTGDGSATSGTTAGDLALNTVGTRNLVDLSVTDAKVAAGLSGSKVNGAVAEATHALSADSAASAADLACTGCIGTVDLADGAVTFDKIAKGAVRGEGAPSVTTPTNGNIALKSIDESNLADGSVAGGAGGVIADGTITADDLQAGSVGQSELQDSAVTTLKLVDGAVTTAKIADGAVKPDKQTANAGMGSITTTVTSGTPASVGSVSLTIGGTSHEVMVNAQGTFACAAGCSNANPVTVKWQVFDGATAVGPEYVQTVSDSFPTVPWTAAAIATSPNPPSSHAFTVKVTTTATSTASVNVVGTLNAVDLGNG